MPASPFGLMYGIGQGLGGVQQAVDKGRETAQNLAMRNLQLQEMQRQQKEAEGMNQVMSEGIDQKIVDMPETEYEKQSAADNAQTESNQASVASLGDEGQGQQAPEFSTTPTAPVSTSAGKKEAYKWRTQHEQMSYELGERAKKLQRLGLGVSAYKLQQESAKFGEMHKDQMSENVAKLLSLGSMDAIPQLHEMGLVNIVAVGKDSDGTLWMRDKEGNYTPLDYGDLSAVASNGKNLANVFAKMNSVDSRIYTAQFNAKMKAAEAAKGRDWKSGENALDRGSREKIAQNRIEWQERVYGPNGKTPAKLLVWNAAEAMVKKDNPGISDEELHRKTSLHPLVSAVGAGIAKMDRQQAHDLVKMFIKIEDGIPEKGSAVYEDYIEAKAKAGGKSPTTDEDKERSNAKSAIEAGRDPVAVKAAFKRRTGKDY